MLQFPSNAERIQTIPEESCAKPLLKGIYLKLYIFVEADLHPATMYSTKPSSQSASVYLTAGPLAYMMFYNSQYDLLKICQDPSLNQYKTTLLHANMYSLATMCDITQQICSKAIDMLVLYMY